MSDLGNNTDWSEVDASNSQNPPNGFPEGMQPSGVNNSARSVMGALKRFWNRSNAVKTTGGTSTAYTLSYDQAASQYYDGEIHSFVVNAVNGASPTLNINGIGSRPLQFYCGGAWAALPPYMLGIGQVVHARYDLSGLAFRCINLPLVLQQTPSGVATVDFSGIPSNVNHIEFLGSLTPSAGDVVVARFYNSVGSVDSASVYYTTGTISQEGTVSGISLTAVAGITMTGWSSSLPVGIELRAKGIQRVTRTPFDVSAAGSNGTPGIASFQGGGFRISDGPITGVRFYCSGGATLTGTLTARLS